MLKLEKKVYFLGPRLKPMTDWRVHCTNISNTTQLYYADTSLTKAFSHALTVLTGTPSNLMRFTLPGHTALAECISLIIQGYDSSVTALSHLSPPAILFGIGTYGGTTHN